MKKIKNHKKEQINLTLYFHLHNFFIFYFLQVIVRIQYFIIKMDS